MFSIARERITITSYANLSSWGLKSEENELRGNVCREDWCQVNIQSFWVREGANLQIREHVMCRACES
jgi:hypothetical protein